MSSVVCVLLIVSASCLDATCGVSTALACRTGVKGAGARTRLYDVPPHRVQCSKVDPTIILSVVCRVNCGVAILLLSLVVCLRVHAVAFVRCLGFMI